MLKLKQKDYDKVCEMVKSQNELSVFSVIHGIMPGSIYVNDESHPTCRKGKVMLWMLKHYLPLNLYLACDTRVVIQK